jgi:hypothetical protein
MNAYVALGIAVFVWYIFAYVFEPRKPECGTPLPDSQPVRVVAALTTTPDAATAGTHLHDALASLTPWFDAVYLALPLRSSKGVEYPEVSYPGVTVTRIPEDAGPLSKYLAATLHEDEPSTLVVHVDDDFVYNPKMRASFEAAHRKHPHAALTNSGLVFKYSSLRLPLWLNTYWQGFAARGLACFRSLPPIPRISGSRAVNVGQGYSGFAITVQSLRGLEEFSKAHAHVSPHTFKNDDIVVSAFLAQQGVPRLAMDFDINHDQASNTGERISGGTVSEFFSFCRQQDEVYWALYPGTFDRDGYFSDAPVLLDIVLVLGATLLLTRV